MKGHEYEDEISEKISLHDREVHKCRTERVTKAVNKTHTHKSKAVAASIQTNPSNFPNDRNLSK